MNTWPDVAEPWNAWQQLDRFGAGVVWDESQQLWVVHTPELVSAVANDPGRFSSAVPDERDMVLDFLLTVDPPRHGVDRRLFLRIFGPRLAAATRGSSEIVRWAGASITATRRLDLVAGFCKPVADAVSSLVVGYLDAPELSRDAPADIRMELLRLSARERPEPSDGEAPFEFLRQCLINEGLRPDVAAGRVSGLACSVLIALHGTLSAAIALAFLGVARGTPPDVGEPVKADSPLLGLFRIARTDAFLDGAAIRAGDRLFLAWGAANRVSENGDYSFGVGPHRCPASRLVNSVVSESVVFASSKWRTTLLENPRFTKHSHFRAPESLVCDVEILDA